jgi:hypothetical protein
MAGMAQMTSTRLTILSIAAVAFALFETWVAYDDRTQRANIFWAAFAWICVVFVAGMWWELRSRK